MKTKEHFRDRTNKTVSWISSHSYIALDYAADYIERRASFEVFDKFVNDTQHVIKSIMECVKDFFSHI